MVGLDLLQAATAAFLISSRSSRRTASHPYPFAMEQCRGRGCRDLELLASHRDGERFENAVLVVTRCTSAGVGEALHLRVGNEAFVEVTKPHEVRLGEFKTRNNPGKEQRMSRKDELIAL